MAFKLASWSQLEKMILKGDVVLMVLDARTPVETFSRKLEGIVSRHGKELLIVLNKSDLVPRQVAEEWKEHFEERGYHAVFTAASKHMGTLRLRRAIKHLSKQLPTTALVAGYPKVGKSTIINALKGRHSAPTSPYPGTPGYTKTFQVNKIDDDLYMIDTPGVIPVEGGELERVLRGYSPEQLGDPVKPALKLIEKVISLNKDAFKLAYGISSLNPLDILEQYAVKRGWFYKSTREPLIEEAARAVIRDYHDGKIPFYERPD
ncbi:MAG: GTPase [Thermosphaera sp.]